MSEKKEEIKYRKKEYNIDSIAVNIREMSHLTGACPMPCVDICELVKRERKKAKTK